MHCYSLARIASNLIMVQREAKHDMNHLITQKAATPWFGTFVHKKRVTKNKDVDMVNIGFKCLL